MRPLVVCVAAPLTLSSFVACTTSVVSSAMGPGTGGELTTFSCGPTTCITGEYCESFTPGTGGGGESYSCLPIPSSCESDPSCACIQPMEGPSCNSHMGGSCTEVGPGSVVLHCNG
jgi:hypothetical protein